MPFRFLAAFCFAIAQLCTIGNAQILSSDCLAIAQGPARVQLAKLVPAALTENLVQLTFIGHSTFLIESSGGLRIATDFSGNAGGVVPDVITMNRAHRSHYTPAPDPAIKNVLRGWNDDGTPAQHDITFGDVHIRNVTTDIRGGTLGRVPDGNSIFVFEVAGLCIGHLGHLHHELTPAHIGQIGRLDVVLVPVDGGYTMPVVNMVQVLKDLKARIVIPMHYFGPETLSRFIANMRGSLEIEMASSPVVIVSRETLPGGAETDCAAGILRRLFRQHDVIDFHEGRHLRQPAVAHKGHMGRVVVVAVVSRVVGKFHRHAKGEIIFGAHLPQDFKGVDARNGLERPSWPQESHARRRNPRHA